MGTSGVDKSFFKKYGLNKEFYMNFKKLLTLSAVFLTVSIQASYARETEKDKEKNINQDTTVQTQMDKIVVSATRFRQKAIDVAGSASFIDQEQILQDQPADISEILETVPGIDISGGGSHSKQPALRGLPESQTIIKIDGARQNYVQKAGDPQSTILVDPEILKEVEVIRGPSSTMHGGGGIGGVISLKTMDAADLLKPGQKAGAKIKAGIRTGDSMKNYSGTAFGRYKDFDIIANTTYKAFGNYHSSARHSENETTEMDGQSVNNLVKLAYLPSDDRRFQINYMNYSHDFEYPDKDNPSKYESDQNRVIGKFESSKSRWLNLSATALYSKREEKQASANPFFGEINNNLEFISSGIDLQNTMKFKTLGNMDHTFIAGFDYYRDEYEPKTSDDMTAYTNPAGYGEDFGGFIQDQIEITDKITFTPGVRYTYYKRSADDSKADDGEKTRFSPKAVLDWTPVSWIGFYAGYSEAFRPPLISEMYTELDVMFGPAHILILANPDLKPETAKNWEFGTRLSFNGIFSSNDALRVKASFFTEEIKDLISLKTVKDMNPPMDMERIVTTENISSVNRHGGEIEAAYANGIFDFSTGYSKVKGHDNDSGEDAGETPGVLNIRTGLKFADSSFKLGWKSKFTESFDDGEEHYHNYNTHSISLRWTPGTAYSDDLAVSMGITNLFDTDYEAYHFKDSGTGMARSLYTSVSYKF